MTLKQKSYTMFMCFLYGIGLITCYVCNLVIDHTLSWFFIVLVSVLISFSITNLSLFVQKHRIIISAIAVSILVYPLLFTCWLYTGGDWLTSLGYPIATFTIVLAWVILIILVYLKMNWGYKWAILLAITAFANLISEAFSAYLIKGELGLSSMDNGGLLDFYVDCLVSVLLLGCAFISMLRGKSIAGRRKHMRS